MDTTLPTPHEHVVSTEFDEGEGVLVDLNTKRYYQLNETAMLVWKCLEKRRTRQEIIDEMVSIYDVSSEHAAASVEKVLLDFQSNKLVQQTS